MMHVKFHKDVIRCRELIALWMPKYQWIWDDAHILKAIKNATGTSAIFHINNSLIYFVFVLTSAPNVGERFTKTWAQLQTSAKNFGEKWQIHQIFW